VKAPWLVGVQATVARWVREYASGSGCELLAYAIMPNHLHILVVQGVRPLSDFMQPLLRRVAILVHAGQGCEGHVFQRRYHSSPCTDPGYLRNTIAYVHLNPVRAGLADRPGRYAWTTHGDYVSRRLPTRDGHGPTMGGLQLFSPNLGARLQCVRSNYLRFLDWRMRADTLLMSEERGAAGNSSSPPTVGGDIYWTERFGGGCTPRAERRLPRRPAFDLRDVVANALQAIAPDMSMDVLRSGGRTRLLVAVRRQVITRAKEDGHRNRSIARFLHVSDVTVSRT